MERLTSTDVEEYVNEIRGRWANAVGRLILSFGEIEWVVYFALAEFARDPIFESVVNLPFARRIELLRAILEGRRSEAPELVEDAISLIDSAKRLAEVRNLLAHNPQRMSLYADDEGKVQRIVEEVTHHRSESRRVSYEELLGHADSACRVERELWSAMSRLAKVLGKTPAA